jgi:hypothetical protein
MATDEQTRNTYATVEAMVNGAAGVMQRLHPEVTVRGWNELTDREKEQMAKAFHRMLAPLGTILTGRPTGDGLNGVRLDP